MGASPLPRSRTAVCAAACLVLAGATSLAMADGQPLILDTQTGIHDGQSGLVLQNAPLSRSAMVPAQQLPAAPQLDSTNGSPPIIVAPYIALPGANGAAPVAGTVNRMLPANHQ